MRRDSGSEPQCLVVVEPGPVTLTEFLAVIQRDRLVLAFPVGLAHGCPGAGEPHVQPVGVATGNV